MAVKLIIENVRTTIIGTFHSNPNAAQAYHDALRKELGYSVQGREWSPKYREGVWDGFISLYNKRSQSFPTGCVGRVIELFKELKVEFYIEYKRPKIEPNLDITTAFQENNRELRFYQQEAANRAVKATRGVLSIATGGGKCLDINTPILTQRGRITMGEVVDGDQVFDETGHWCNVVKAHDVLYDRPCYKISFSTGEDIISCDEHLWAIRLSPCLNRATPRRTMSTQQMFDVMHGHTALGRREPAISDRSLFFIDKAEALHFDENKDLLIDPYILGLWLGDGSKHAGIISSKDEEIIQTFHNHGYQPTFCKESNCDWRIREFRPQIRQLGLLNNKRIPIHYLRSSIKNRLQLLRGIIDTDGCVDIDGGVEIGLSDFLLACDTLELIRNLGYLAYMSENQAWLYDKRCKNRFRIKFTTNDLVSLLPRKSKRLVNGKNRATNRRIYITNIEKVDTRPVRCLTVDSPNRLYLVGRTLIPTHNTMLACEILSRVKVAPFLFYVPSISLLRQTKEEFEKYLRIDGSPAKIGMIGDNVCDIHHDGINIITYQTALNAFNEKYQAKGDKVVQDEYAGERVRKPLSQLQAEHDEALLLLDQKQREAEKQFVNLLKDDGSRSKAYISAIAKHTKIARETYNKTKGPLDSRLTSLDNKKNIRKLITNARGIIVDEAHVAAIIIEALGAHSTNAYYKIGVTATPWREDNQQIRIEGAMGKKLIEVPSSDLIDLGFLVPPHIFMIHINHIESSDDYTDAYQKHIVDCWERNYRIKQAAEYFKGIGRPVLILVERLEHGQILESMIKDSVFVPGKDKGGLFEEEDTTDEERNYRRRMLNKTEANDIILIATQWAYVGIDAPAIATLVLAGSCQSSVATYQMVGRVLRTLGKNIHESIANGKPEAVVIDFMDSEKNLHKHSLRRKQVYRLERNFKLTMLK